MSRWPLATAVLLAGLAFTQPVLAQQRSPGVDDAGPRMVSPRDCTVEPQPVAQLSRILDLEGEGIPRQPYLTVAAPLGPMVDAATLIHVKRTVRGILACINAGNRPRATAWMTDHGIQRVYGGLTVDQIARQDATARLDTPPEPRPWEQWIRLLAVSDVSTLPDGRVVAFVVI